MPQLQHLFWFHVYLLWFLFELNFPVHSLYAVHIHQSSDKVTKSPIKLSQIFSRSFHQSFRHISAEISTTCSSSKHLARFCQFLMRRWIWFSMQPLPMKRNVEASVTTGGIYRQTFQQNFARNFSAAAASASLGTPTMVWIRCVNLWFVVNIQLRTCQHKIL